MPAVLLEAGSIIHREEELMVLAPERRGLITDSVVEAVVAYCTQRSKPNTTVVRTAKTSPAAARTSKVNATAAQTSKTNAAVARTPRAKQAASKSAKPR
jgi:hypothetical protein